jgi:hypothetical protein
MYSSCRQLSASDVGVLMPKMAQFMGKGIFVRHQCHRCRVAGGITGCVRCEPSRGERRLGEGITVLRLSSFPFEVIITIVGGAFLCLGRNCICLYHAIEHLLGRSTVGRIPMFNRSL